MRDPVPESLRRFIWDLQSMVELAESEREILVVGRDLMSRLVASDDWLPAVFSAPAPRQVPHHLLYSDGAERFCVVAAVFSAGQAAPICREPVWEIMGLLRGSLTRQSFSVETGKPPVPKGEARRLLSGAIDIYSSKSGDAVQMANGSVDGISISIHAYGGEIGKLARSAYDPNGHVREFVSGYANLEDAAAYDIWSIQSQILD